jgi:hypothetical protein
VGVIALSRLRDHDVDGFQPAGVMRYSVRRLPPSSRLPYLSEIARAHVPSSFHGDY